MTETNIAIVNEEYLKDKIYIIRGQKVMLDSDLAKIYGYSTKAFNQQIQRNIDKFDEDFMFQLTDEEISVYIRSQFVTGSHRNERYRPYVFTEKGIYMLMTVLRGDLAIKQSKTLIRLFDSMKNYIVENRELLSYKDLEIQNIKLEVKDVKKDVETIKEDNRKINYHLNNVDNSLNKVMSNFIDPSLYKHFLILDGKKLEADNAYISLFKLAKSSIIYIDDYINHKTLELLSYIKKNVSLTIISDNKARPSLKKDLINDFITQNKSNKLTLLKSNNKIHDRYIIIDFNTNNETIYHCGTSLKDAGNKITTIQKVEESSLYTKLINKLLKGPKLII